jgi:hypothetical protein
MMSTQVAGSSTAEVIDVGDLDPVAWYEFALEQGWSDGLPLMAPTEAAVQAMVETYRGPDLALQLPPRMVLPTLKSLAANAVMAGCKPEYFSTIVAAVRAMVVPAFNLHGMLATTHPCSVTVMVGGPIRHELSINCSTNCFGPGWRANATIGRALNLITRNIGGAVPGQTDRSTQGSPAKYSFCFGENEEHCPWEPYRVRQGFDRSDSIVTVFASEGPHNINDHGSTDGVSLLKTYASVMSQAGANSMYGEGPMLLAIGQEHAAMLARDGWTIEGLQRHLFAAARIPGIEISAGNKEYYGRAGKVEENGAYAITPTAEDIHIVVAGGPGMHSAYIPGLGPTVLSSMRIV